MILLKYDTIKVQRVYVFLKTKFKFLFIIIKKVRLNKYSQNEKEKIFFVYKKRG